MKNNDDNERQPLSTTALVEEDDLSSFLSEFAEDIAYAASMDDAKRRQPSGAKKSKDEMDKWRESTARWNFEQFRAQKRSEMRHERKLRRIRSAMKVEDMVSIDNRVFCHPSMTKADIFKLHSISTSNVWRSLSSLGFEEINSNTWVRSMTGEVVVCSKKKSIYNIQPSTAKEIIRTAYRHASMNDLPFENREFGIPMPDGYEFHIPTISRDGKTATEIRSTMPVWSLPIVNPPILDDDGEILGYDYDQLSSVDDIVEGLWPWMEMMFNYQDRIRTHEPTMWCYLFDDFNLVVDNYQAMLMADAEEEAERRLMKEEWLEEQARRRANERAERERYSPRKKSNAGAKSKSKKKDDKPQKSAEEIQAIVEATRQAFDGLDDDSLYSDAKAALEQITATPKIDEMEE